MREGNDFLEHIARFRAGGKYHGVIPLNHWVLVVFEPDSESPPQVPFDDRDHIVVARFSPNFASTTLFSSPGKETVPLLGHHVCDCGLVNACWYLLICREL